METMLHDGESNALINSHLHQSWSLFFDFLPLCLLFYPLIGFGGCSNRESRYVHVLNPLLPVFHVVPFPLLSLHV